MENTIIKPTDIIAEGCCALINLNYGFSFRRIVLNRLVLLGIIRLETARAIYEQY